MRIQGDRTKRRAAAARRALGILALLPALASGASLLACGSGTATSPGSDSGGDGDQGVEAAPFEAGDDAAGETGDARPDAGADAPVDALMDAGPDADAGGCNVPIAVGLMSPAGPPSPYEVGAVAIDDAPGGCPIKAGGTITGASIQFGWSTDTNLGSVSVVAGAAGWHLVAGPDAATGIAAMTETVIDLADARGDALSVTFRFGVGGGAAILEQIVYTAASGGQDAGAG